MYFQLMMVGCLVIASDVTSAVVIPETFEGSPGDVVEVYSANYLQLLDSYAENGVKHEDVKYYLEPYNMTNRLVYTYLFTLKASRGTVRVVFEEYDLSPYSTIYIYDGIDNKAPGSAWMYFSPLPVYSSTGTHLFMVFKAGFDPAMNNTHLGFAATVYFTEETAWLSPPMTGFCSDLHESKTFDGREAEIIYFTEDSNPSVFCSYTSHVTNEELVIVSSVPGIKIDLRDSPSAVFGDSIQSDFYSNDTSDRYAEIHVFNVTSATHGFHLKLAPPFTKLLQRVIVSLGESSEALRANTMKRAMKQHAPRRHKCPYKTCGPTEIASCADMHTLCNNSLDILLDGTCDHYDVFPKYYVCGGNTHCYNSITDHCDGFYDCPDGDDEPEEYCTPTTCETRDAESRGSRSASEECENQGLSESKWYLSYGYVYGIPSGLAASIILIIVIVVLYLYRDEIRIRWRRYEIMRRRRRWHSLNPSNQRPRDRFEMNNIGETTED